MSERLLILERDVRKDLEVLERLWDQLDAATPNEDAGDEHLIAVAYRLHNIYCGCENIFRNIASAFENSIEADSGWHAQLVRRMTLDLSPLRPAVIDDEAAACLDEMRRFRHLFRSAYGIDFDPQRLGLVLAQSQKLRPIFAAQIERFLKFVVELLTRTTAQELLDWDRGDR